MSTRERHWTPGNSPLPSQDGMFLVEPSGYHKTRSSMRRLALFAHGYDSTTADGGYAFEVGGPLVGHPKALAESGVIVMSPNLGGGTFGSKLFYDRVLEAIAWAKANYGIPDGNCYGIGHSMGSLNWLSFCWFSYLAGVAPSSVIRGLDLFSLAADLEAGYALGGYSPAYALSVAQGGFAPQIAAGHGLTGHTAKNAGPSAAISGGTVQLNQTLNRTLQHRLQQTGSLTFTINGITMTATGFSTTTLTNDTLTGVSSAGATATWTAGAAMTVTYQNAGIGLISPIANAAGYATAFGSLPVNVSTSNPDSVVGYAATPYWVGLIGKSATVKERTPVPSGTDHSGPYKALDPKLLLASIHSAPGWV